MSPVSQRRTRLLVLLCGLFVTNALMAEFIGVKIFALEETLGLAPLDWNLFGQSGSLSFTAGVMLWPVVFIMTDIINEYFGVRGVRFVSWLTVGLIAYAFLFAYAAIELAPASWWVTVAGERGVPDMQAAFASVFGQGLWTIGGSITAFLIGQLIDVAVFHRIRTATGERWIWLRATGSTAISQLVDSFVVLYIAFVLGPQQWSMDLFLAVGTLNYGYKMLMAVALIPLIYLGRSLIERYLGATAAAVLKAEASGGVRPHSDPGVRVGSDPSGTAPRTPALAVDLVIELVDRPGWPIVLIERRHPPTGHALPGGFVDVGETVEAAARREALEETGLEVTLRSLLGVYSEPARDPRGHTVSIVYVAEARGTPVAGDDAAAVRIVTLNDLPPLAFDHGRILADYARTRREG